MRAALSYSGLLGDTQGEKRRKRKTATIVIRVSS
jgi:hypothetical protein